MSLFITTSVPQVRPISEITWQLGRMLELSLEVTLASGDRSFVNDAIREIRWWHENLLKEAANLGRMDAVYFDKLIKALERLEKIHGI